MSVGKLMASALDNAVVADLHVGEPQIAMDDALLGARQSAVRSPAAQSSGQRGRRGVGETGWFHPGFSPRKNPTETQTGGFGPPDRGQADGAVMLESRETLGI